MRSLIVAVTVITSAVSAQAAETWTCTSLFEKQPLISRFEVSPPNLIEAKFHQTYRIEQNNEYGIVAISTISQVEQGQTRPSVGAVSIVINKVTGEFLWVTAMAGQPAAVNQPSHGKCIKD